MKTVISRDGTPIAFDTYGSGPAVILVGGAFQQRAGDEGMTTLAEQLGQHFTAYYYDRRGRGDSGNTLPFAIQREVEDIEALINDAGGSASLFGMSSGGALALEAAIALPGKVKKVAVYEVPYNIESPNALTWKQYREQLATTLREGRKGDAAALFMKLVGTPDEQIAGMRHAPFWQGLEAVAPTLAYDAAVLGDDSSVPVERVAKIAVPTLVLTGSATYPFMQNAADALVGAIPKAERGSLADQSHNVDPNMLAPVLDKFYSAS